MLRALNQLIFSRATPGARKARVELETDEGEGEQKTVSLQQHEVRRPAASLVATGTTGQLVVQLEDPMYRPAKKLKHVSKERKVVSIVKVLQVV